MRDILQMNLFSQSDLTGVAPGDSAPGSADICSKLRIAVTATIKRCPHSRWQIAARMSELLDKEISKSMLDCWTSDSKVLHRFPAEFIPAFCLATGDNSVLAVISEAAHCRCIRSDELVHLELGRLADLEKQIADRKKALKSQLTLNTKGHAA